LKEGLHQSFPFPRQVESTLNQKTFQRSWKTKLEKEVGKQNNPIEAPIATSNFNSIELSRKIHHRNKVV
jgi:hypothetical protein